MSATEVQTSLQTWIDQAEALVSKDYSSDDRHFLPEIKVTVSVLTLSLSFKCSQALCCQCHNLL